MKNRSERAAATLTYPRNMVCCRYIKVVLAVVVVVAVAEAAMIMMVTTV